MVGIGTILTLGIVGAAVAVGYGLYRNSAVIGTALSRGVETSVVNPIGNWFDSLFQPLKDASGSIITTTPQQETVYDPLTEATKDLRTVNDPADVRTWTPGYQPPPEQDYQPPAPPPPPEPTTTYKSGYYYADYVGSQYDTQWYLSAGEAESIAKTAAAPGDAFLGIKYTGVKLSAAGFKLFGESQNYL